MDVFFPAKVLFDNYVQNNNLIIRNKEFDCL